MSCRDRHCPSCGHSKAREWEAARCEELVEGPFFHYVFTVPGDLYPLFLLNRRRLYDLFHALVRAVLLAFSLNPRHLGGTPWVMAVLHTTHQQLGFHPHIHVLLAGVGYNEEDEQLVRCPKDDFLFPARALASSFRGRFLSELRRLLKAGELELGSGKPKANRRKWLGTVKRLFRVKWQVHTKAAYGGARQTVAYLARYVERTAISNRRIVKVTDTEVTFRYTNRKLGRKRTKTVSLLEFARLFERHILPKGFVRIRRFGLLSSRKRKELLPKVQELAAKAAGASGWTPPTLTLRPEPAFVERCSECGSEDVVLEGMDFRPHIPLFVGRKARPPPSLTALPEQLLAK